MAQHVKVIGALCIVFGAIYAIIAVFGSVVLAFLANFVGSSGETDAELGATALGFAGVALTIVLGFFAAAYLVTGWGLLKLKPWARIVGIIVAVLSLTKFPLGTAFGIYALVIFFRKETEALFAKQADRPAGP